MQKNVLVIGSGGREHAIGRKLKQSSLIENVYCAPGNAGMEKDAIISVDIAENDHVNLLNFVQQNKIAWTFVGPEVPLLDGVVDTFAAAGEKIFGPCKAAALIEGSKDFAKTIMTRYHIPTAAYQTFTSYSEAMNYVETKGTPIVIKADGLAAGKGVVVATSLQEATLALKDMLLDNKFGSSGSQVVIEEFLAGEEFSLQAFVRGEEVYPMVIAQDHKRAYENDRGPNTGGMGAYSPVPQIPSEMVEEAIETILKPCAAGLCEEGRPFVGILYAGLIATSEGPKVIEFNARFGDPETQVVLERLDSDFAQVIDDLLLNRKPTIRWKKTGYNLGVVIAADGYPGSYEKDILLPDLDSLDQVHTFYAGVKKRDDQLVSDGGRIYLLEAAGETLEEAQKAVYQKLDQLDTKGTFYRSDIGWRAINEVN